MDAHDGSKVIRAAFAALRCLMRIEHSLFSHESWSLHHRRHQHYAYYTLQHVQDCVDAAAARCTFVQFGFLFYRQVANWLVIRSHLMFVSVFVVTLSFPQDQQQPFSS